MVLGPGSRTSLLMRRIGVGGRLAHRTPRPASFRGRGLVAGGRCAPRPKAEPAPEPEPEPEAGASQTGA